jgi:hypothetical protein
MVGVYGYRCSEQELPVPGPTKDGFELKIKEWSNPMERPVVKASLGCHIQGVALPHVDHTDVTTVIAGVKKRFANKPPTPKKWKLRGLKRFTLRWCRKNVTPLSPHVDTSVSTWLDGTHYPDARKKELLDKWLKCGGVLKPKHFRVKSFVKDESYPEYKHARSINARSDEFKCAVGPIFKLIEEQVYANKFFIKHIPVKDRPQYIKDNVYLPGAKYCCTDYTAFEAHFTRELMEACEFVLYEYMTSRLPDGPQFMWYCRNVIGGLNTCLFKKFKIKIPATRMSGEMCTSLGNGFANLMFFLYLAKLNGCKKIRGVVEGDDGLFTCIGEFPTADQYRDLGLTIKIELTTEISEASFCGLVFHPDDNINITDPMKVIANTGYTLQQYMLSSKKTHRGLLKAKAYSMLYQFPGCPIIAAFARYLLRVLVDDYVYFAKNKADYHLILQKEAFTFWSRHKDQLEVETPLATRFLMESKFSIPVKDQIAIEHYFDGLNEIQPLTDPTILYHCPQIWKSYYDDYALVTPKDGVLSRFFFD